MTSTVLFDPSKVIPSYTHTHPLGDESHFDYTHELEQAVASACYGEVIEYAPTGYFPYYDFVCRIERQVVKIELKIHEAPITKAQPYYKVEQRRANSTLSALALSTADFYHIMTREYNKGSWVVKNRLFSVARLKQLGQQPDVIGQPYFYIKPRDMSHVWLGDFSVNSEDNTWDVRSLTRKNPNVERDCYVYTKAVGELLWTQWS